MYMGRAIISHDGIVTSVSRERIKVEILSESACSSCHARGLCGASEEKVKTVDVRVLPGETLPLAGDRVTVGLRRSLGLGAVALSYAVPVLILMVSIVSLSALGLSEWIVGAAAIACVGLYYLVLFLLKNRIAGKYEFQILKTDKLND